MELADGRVAMRDAKRPEDGVIRFSRTDFAQFLADIREGWFDLP